MTDKKNKHAEFVTEDNGVARVQLSRPRKIEGRELSVIEMREPTVEDMENYQDGKGSDSAREVRMIANLCELNPDDVRKFSLRDYARLQAAFELFTN